MEISDDLHPQVLLTFGGKFSHREPETLDAENFIAKKGLAAKGKKCHAYDLKKVAFTEPLHKPEDDEEPDEPAPAKEEEVIDVDIDITARERMDIDSSAQSIRMMRDSKETRDPDPDDDGEVIDLTLF